MNNKELIIQWLYTKYDEHNTYYDYCYNIYYEILDYCCKNNLRINIPTNVFLGHLISIIYDTYQ